MAAQTAELKAALRDLIAGYQAGGPTGERACQRAIHTLTTLQEELPVRTPLWRRLNDLGDLQDLPLGQQFGAIFRSIAALVHADWSGPEVAAWLVLEAKRAEQHE